ncbi:hypothetical protein [Sulfitobacter sabulilitoris]|uniref:DUF1344 domain-containing protein n=1 Tax=Sulfitobacter sabulilitoris TaxID=2562655 RepID=A0A5S3PBU2_9RHOB|nr:hypothetical protein [Sulfitobacter sabulilitoris]TMM51166.1 hypothetical protein FDT80_14990 [Sulfitobacter sabulilitoris]
MRRFVIPALMLAATPVFADEVSGTILAFDRVDHILVMEDKTVLTVPNPEVIPEGLMAGDTIKVEFQSDGDNGVVKVNSIEKQ